MKHVTPLWYVFPMNATTNTPRPPCPDVLVEEGGVKEEAVGVAHPIPSLLTPVVPPTQPSLLSIDDGPPPLDPSSLSSTLTSFASPPLVLSVLIHGRPLPILLSSITRGKKDPIPPPYYLWFLTSLLLLRESWLLTHSYCPTPCWAVPLSTKPPLWPSL
jgi:hypothetical protein